MPRRSLTAVAGGIAVAAALVLAGCSSPSAAPAAGGAADPDAIITVGSQNEPTSLDQIGGGSSGVTEVFTGNVYEGLFRITDDAEVEPLLAAETSVSDDGLTYTFTLADATFHSGDPVTADDVKYSLERFISEESIAARKRQLSVIDTVTVVDDKTVDVTLVSKSVSFTYNLGYVWIVNDTATDRATTEDGSGPYTLADYRKGDSITLDRYADYWGDEPANGGVVYQYYADPTALNNALLTGAVDLVTSQSNPDGLAQFDNDDFTIIEGTSTTKEILGLNDRIAPFDSVDVRKAIYSAIDRERLLDSIWDGRGQLIGSMVPPSEPWYIDLADNNPYDVELAEDLLAQAGYADGFEFTIDTPDSGVHSTVAEFIKSELAKVGVTVNINIITDDEWYEKIYTNHDFQATLQGHVNDRDINFYGNPDFYWGYNDADVQTWLAESEAADSVEAQTDLVKLANQKISDDAASVWLYLNPQLRIAASTVTGVPENGLNSLFYVAGIAKAAS
ncbi:ABC transporter substrate-binding protein [Agromyces atrinae]|uniref:ABC transporter substrate-binding protein n=1 Tax=Agromyces atrinae TaxID=592376 RepID=A0A4Q2M3R4_9MICO|nr:ABC transporter substrate-binding protein [Agromyces atrinae]NYD68775.1 peptide/nickel transport system substrate-binding protein [Agromyces atrinae]RXZ85072.1 ABC transporter substrate-binding protein [Agromyces atrinae]RXZ85847.1 ABC transporter substrate-binding protein [Agromyces atrinae]